MPSELSAAHLTSSVVVEPTGSETPVLTVEVGFARGEHPSSMVRKATRAATEPLLALVRATRASRNAFLTVEEGFARGECPSSMVRKATRAAPESLLALKQAT